jgi:hypothetical protein
MKNKIVTDSMIWDLNIQLFIFEDIWIYIMIILKYGYKCRKLAARFELGTIPRKLVPR